MLVDTVGDSLYLCLFLCRVLSIHAGQGLSRGLPWEDIPRYLLPVAGVTTTAPPLLRWAGFLRAGWSLTHPAWKFHQALPLATPCHPASPMGDRGRVVARGLHALWCAQALFLWLSTRMWLAEEPLWVVERYELTAWIFGAMWRTTLALV